MHDIEEDVVVAGDVRQYEVTPYAARFRAIFPSSSFLLPLSFLPIFHASFHVAAFSRLPFSPAFFFLFLLLLFLFRRFFSSSFLLFCFSQKMIIQVADEMIDTIPCIEAKPS